MSPLVDIHHHRKRDQAEAQRDVHLAIHLCGGGDGVGRDGGDGRRDFGVLGGLGGFRHFCDSIEEFVVVVVVVVVDGISEVKEKGCLGTVVEALVVWGRRGAGT